MGTCYPLLGSAAEGMDALLHAQHGEKHSARDVRTERSGRLGKYLRNEEQRDAWLLEGSWLEVLPCDGSRRGHCSVPPSCALGRIWGESGSSLSCHGVGVLCSAPNRGCTSGSNSLSDTDPPLPQYASQKGALQGNTHTSVTNLRIAARPPRSLTKDRPACVGLAREALPCPARPRSSRPRRWPRRWPRGRGHAWQARRGPDGAY